ncbi:glycosyltransferase family 90 protein [Mixia osmundae IAM 14324]|uniref:Glycosyl transferase CAP10 domain-containing protein n=1 Tax=Mixia osmundae (strain CBS 9802 / IAM 14324 / JCM 22182 / KY 12970) TaxID=764103 RepID=G7E0V8_MIXOS|nr:glycosyltransferase family 90 protein [Mixia osmundae IAM 14324]KEI39498.1 glycosyltransferase family 90 protein [Mixia osmundae IAM 14324]GAA96468.1 hypothetical protein E5Q_03135 [Mixia osmundae IAM 14324]
MTLLKGLTKLSRYIILFLVAIGLAADLADWETSITRSVTPSWIANRVPAWSVIPPHSVIQVGYDGQELKPSSPLPDLAFPADRFGRAERLAAEAGLGTAQHNYSISSHTGELILADRSGAIPHDLGVHPIRALMSAAQARWDKLHVLQSQDLPQAVEEYMRRYDRSPPRGFDRWWKYAVENNVQLKDEYDGLFRGIEPYFAIPASILRSRTVRLAEENASLAMLVTLDPHAPSKDRLNYHAHEQSQNRVKDALEDMRHLIGLLPEGFDMVCWLAEAGYSGISYEHKEHLRHLARKWEEITQEEADGFRPVQAHTEQPFLDLCPGGSALALALNEQWFNNLTVSPDLPESRAFIYDHQLAKDACNTPEIYWGHDQAHRAGIHRRILPMFVRAHTSTRSDILMPSRDITIKSTGLYDDGSFEPEWDQKAHAKLYWRGPLTGASFDNTARKLWQSSPRFRLIRNFQTRAASVRRRIWAEKMAGTTVRHDVSYNHVVKHFTDFALTGRPIQCQPEVCKELEALVSFVPEPTPTEHLEYKYLLDIDGNGYSSFFFDAMNTNSAVFKSTVFDEWWSERIMPWLHYVPVHADYSDIPDIMTFFEGVSANGQNSILAKKIADEGKAWVNTFAREEDKRAYHYRLLLEWMRLWHRNEDDDWSFELPETDPDLGPPAPRSDAHWLHADSARRGSPDLHCRTTEVLSISHCLFPQRTSVVQSAATDKSRVASAEADLSWHRHQRDQLAVQEVVMG